MLSPLGNHSFDATNSFFCQHKGTAVGKIDALTEGCLKKLQAESAQYEKLDRSTLLAILAARSLKIEDNNTAVNIGSSRGATGLWEEFHKQFVKTGSLPVPTSPLTTLGNISSWVAQDIGVKGINFSHSITCATAAHSILNAIAWLESGMATTFIAGGSEAPLTDFTIAQMKALRIYSQEKGDYKCLALDANKTKNTMVLGEAAACFVLSKKKIAGGVKITGFGTAVESLKSATSMSAAGDGFQNSMRLAMAGRAPQEIDAIVTHAPGTIQGDQSELQAIKKVFDNPIGDPSNPRPRLLNNKWQLGHSLGASAAVNLFMAIQLLNNEIDPKIPYLNTNAHLSIPNGKAVKRVLINASGFGGNCVSLLIEKD